MVAWHMATDAAVAWLEAEQTIKRKARWQKQYLKYVQKSV